MELENKVVIFVGLNDVGIAVAKGLLDEGAILTVGDKDHGSYRGCSKCLVFYCSSAASGLKYSRSISKTSTFITSKGLGHLNPAAVLCPPPPKL